MTDSRSNERSDYFRKYYLQRKDDPEFKRKNAERNQKWRLENRDKRRKTSLKWKKANPEKVRDWQISNPEKARNGFLKSKYGITAQQYDEMLRSQGGRCAICRTESCVTGRRFAVDHCHDTGKVRGLLCKSCNIGIGEMKHDSQILLRAAQYLENGDVS